MKRLIVFLALAVSLGIAQTPSAQPVPMLLMGEVHPGGSFEITFEFPSFPTNSGGDANILVVNGGANNNGASWSWVDLYVDNKLVRTVATISGAVLAAFTEPGATFVYWSFPTDLSGVWAGRRARIAFRPVFDEAVANPYIIYQVNWLFAARDTGDGTYDDQYVNPDIVRTQVRRHARIQ